MIDKLSNTGHGHRFFVWLYNVAHKLLRGRPSPHARGKYPSGAQTPHQELNLQVDEVVRVKPHEEILKTLNVGNLNRGMCYDKEMVRYCGGQHRVTARVTKVIDESTGKLLTMATPSVILEGTYCTGQYSERRLMCMRRMVPFWREIWLERVRRRRNTIGRSGSQ